MTYTQNGFIFDDDGRVLTVSMAGGEALPTGAYQQNGFTFDEDGKLIVLSDSAQSGSSPDADATTKGLVQLAGDLTGTAASPQIAAGAVGTTELAANAVTAAKVAADVATQAELDAVAAAAQPLDSDLTAIAALSTTSFGRALLALADAAAGRTALGLGTASTQATGAFDASGAAAAAQAASQPLDSDLTAIAALTTTSYGRSLLTQANAAAARSTLGVDAASPVVVHFFGHSFATGTGATSGFTHAVTGNAPTSQYGYTQRITRALNCREINKASGGSLAQTTGTGGWHEVPTAFAHVPRKAASTDGISLPARAQVVSLDWGVNEGGSAPDLVGFKHGLRSAICFSRASVRFKYADSSSSVATTGGSPQGAGAIYVGDRLIEYNSNGNTVTLTVPSWFPGGEICAYFIGSDTQGGIITPTVDGVAGSAGDFRTPTNKASQFCCCVLRLTGLAAGAHTIVLTLSSKSTGGGLYFDSWTMQAPIPPLVIAHDVAPSDSTASPNLYAATNTALSAVVAEFTGSEVKVLSRAALLTDVDNLTADTLHPNDPGHAIIASAFVDLLNASTYPPATHLLAA